MEATILLLATLVVLLILAAMVAMAVGSVHWNRSTERWVGRLRSAEGKRGRRSFASREIESLPEPVARYLRAVIPESRPLIHAVRIEHRGDFRTGESDSGWRPFESTQHYSIHPPGFVWDARIQMAPFMPVRVRDAYFRGEGVMKANILSLIPVANERGEVELGRGALQRYLAETVWFPTALLPCHGVRWEAIDDRTAEATLADSGIEVSLRFSFNGEGLVEGISTPERYREVEGRYVATPWTGVFKDYQTRHGMRIPLEGEVAWILPEGRHPYWRARIVAIDYDAGG